MHFLFADDSLSPKVLQKSLAQWVKPLLAMLASHTLVPGVLDVPVLTKLPANMPGNVADNGPNSRVLAARVGKSSEVFTSWLQFGPNMAVVSVWEVNH